MSTLSITRLFKSSSDKFRHWNTAKSLSVNYAVAAMVIVMLHTFSEVPLLSSYLVLIKTFSLGIKEH